MSEPTNNQEAFAIAYVANGGNATKAAMEAGYSVKSCRQIGGHLLAKGHVRAAIRDAQFHLLNGPLASKALVVLETALDPLNDVPWGVRVDAARTVLDRAGLVLPEQPQKQTPASMPDLGALLAKLLAAKAIMEARRLEVTNPGAETSGAAEVLPSTTG